MKKDRDFNIFDEASKRLSKKKKKKSIAPLSASLDSLDAQSRRESSEVTPQEDKDVQETLRRIHEIDDSLEEKMSRICQLTGMTRDEVQSFIDNPDNFASEQWRRAQKEKELLEEKIYAVIGMKEKKSGLKKKKKKLTKGRRGKTLGGRKGWIQM